MAFKHARISVFSIFVVLCTILLACAYPQGSDLAPLDELPLDLVEHIQKGDFTIVKTVDIDNDGTQYQGGETGLQPRDDDDGNPHMACLIQYKFLYMTFRIRGVNWDPDKLMGGAGLEQRINNECGAVTGFTFERTPGIEFDWYAVGNTIIGTRDCIRRCITEAGGPDLGDEECAQ